MTGRARGRARGRSRGTAQTAQTATPRPGDAPKEPSATTEQKVGRGGRGKATLTQAKPQEQQQQEQQEQVQRPPTEAPVEQIQALQISSKEPSPPATTAAAAGRGGRGRGYSEPVTRPEHIQDKRGTSGRPLSVMSNYVRMNSRPNCALYQYNVSYSPPIENKRLRMALLYSYEGIGKTKAFDGMVLYLPHKLPDQVTKYTTKTQREQNVIEVSITLTNELNANSPVCLQLFNVIFRRYDADNL